MDSICYLMCLKNNKNIFSIKNKLIEIKIINWNVIDYFYIKYLFEIVDVNKDCLRLICFLGFLSGNLNVLFIDILKFVRVKKKNNFWIRCVSFFVGSCCGFCLFFKLEMNLD